MLISHCPAIVARDPSLGVVMVDRAVEGRLRAADAAPGVSVRFRALRYSLKIVAKIQQRDAVLAPPTVEVPHRAVKFTFFIARVQFDAASTHDLRGNKIYGAFVLNRRVDLHAIDVTPAR